MYLSSEDIKTEDWSRHEEFHKLRVVCYSGHEFYSHSKFSGHFVSIVSMTPCPVCSTHLLRAAYSDSELQHLTQKDADDAKEVS